MARADDLDRFFPVVPQNAPPDDLAVYLTMYAREQGALYRSETSGAKPNAYEHFVNPSFPKMRALKGLAGFGIVGQVIGADPSAIVDSTGNLIVSAVWLQRALNAAGIATGVDGVVGPQTMTNVVAAWRNLTASNGTQPSLQVTGSSISAPGHVKIPPALAGVLAAYTQVADPPPVSHPSTSDATPYAAAVGTAVGNVGSSLMLGAVVALGLIVALNPKNRPSAPLRRARGR